MQNAECRTRNAEGWSSPDIQYSMVAVLTLLHSLFCIMHCILSLPQVRRALARESRQDLAGSSAKRCLVSLRGAWGI
jgi:hypothetical protein